MEGNYLDTNIIFENKFSKEILSLGEKIVLKEKIEGKNEFIMQTLNLISEINEKFYDINYTYLHILNYPENTDYRKIFPLHKYNSYHIEMYSIKIISLYDRLLHLLNLLYDLGLKGLGLKLYNIKKSGKVDKKILSIMENFNSKIKELREGQNYIKHEGSLEIKELERIKTFEFLINHSGKLEKEEKEKMELFIKVNYKIYLNKYKENFLNNSKFIAEFVNNILDELYPIFIKRIK